MNMVAINYRYFCDVALFLALAAVGITIPQFIG